MAAPTFEILQEPKGISDFTLILKQPPFQDETFEADRNGLFDFIPALDRRARYEDLPATAKKVWFYGQQYDNYILPLPPGEANEVPWDTVIDIQSPLINDNYGFGWFLQPQPLGYFRINCKIMVGGVLNGEWAQIRYTIDNSGNIFSLNRKYNLQPDGTPLELYLDKTIYFSTGGIFTVFLSTITAGAFIIGSNNSNESDNYLQVYH